MKHEFSVIYKCSLVNGLSCISNKSMSCETSFHQEQGLHYNIPWCHGSSSALWVRTTDPCVFDTEHVAGWKPAHLSYPRCTCWLPWASSRSGSSRWLVGPEQQVNPEESQKNLALRRQPGHMLEIAGVWERKEDSSPESLHLSMWSDDTKFTFKSQGWPCILVFVCFLPSVWFISGHRNFLSPISCSWTSWGLYFIGPNMQRDQHSI